MYSQVWLNGRAHMTTSSPVTAPDLELAHGHRVLRFPAAWLRDNCPCAGCLDPGTGQKLRSVLDIPADAAVASVEETADSVAVVHAPDGHRSVFSRSWLTGHALTGAGAGDGRTEDSKRLWQGGGPGARGPGRTWRRSAEQPAGRR